MTINVCNKTKSETGKHPWNKGLTKETSVGVAKQSKKMSGNKNALGHTCSAEFSLLMSGLKTGNNYALGHVVDSDTRKLISVRTKEGMSSDDTRKRLKWRSGLTKDTDERVLKQSITLSNSWKDPEFAKKHHLTHGGGPSKPQLKLYNFLKQIFDTAELEYFVPKKDKGYYKLDIALPDDMIDFEYDSKRYHIGQNKNGGFYEEQDKIRDEYLRSLGWTVVRIAEKELRSFIFSKN
jgi:hypothetical protein